MYVCMYVCIYVCIVCIFMMCTCMYITHPWTINEPHLPKKNRQHAFVHAHEIALSTSWLLQCSWWDLAFFRETWFINYCSWMYTFNCVSPRTKREELRYIGVQTTPTHSVSTCWLTGWVHTSLFSIFGRLKQNHVATGCTVYHRLTAVAGFRLLSWEHIRHAICYLATQCFDQYSLVMV